LGAAAINFRSVSKDDGRDPGFVKPLGAGSNHGGVNNRSVAAEILRLRLRGQASIVSAAARELMSAV
jgi:hypothetical protein